MSYLDPVWSTVGILVIIFGGFFLREIVLLARMPKGHPENGYYLFNSAFMLFLIGAVAYVGFYIDSGRRALEDIIPIPAETVYALGRNPILHDTFWVYTTKENTGVILNFYRTYAVDHHINHMEDGARISFDLPSGPLYLTITEEAGETILYFSREGERRVITKE